MENTPGNDEADAAWRQFLDSGYKDDYRLRLSKLFCLLTRRRKFKDYEVESRFREKEGRLQAAFRLDTPDRVPVITNGTSFYPAYYSGVSFADYVMDRRKCAKAYLKFVRENTFFDAVYPPQVYNVGRLLALSQIDFIKLPGVHLPEDVPYQFIEKERMSPDEYPELLSDGFAFFKRVILPRISPVYNPDRGWGLPLRVRLGIELLNRAVGQNRLLNVAECEYGVPALTPAVFFEPYDLVAILLRGLVGVSRDMATCPEMLQKAAELATPFVVEFLQGALMRTGVRVASILCERAFSLSPRQFARFVLPGLKEVVKALTGFGVAPVITLEGDCTHLFELLTELPSGRCACNVDTGDIFKAKKVLDGHMCVIGNVPQTMLVTGSPSDVREYCERLVQEVAPGGGYILSAALGIPDNARHENVYAMVEYVLEHGKY